MFKIRIKNSPSNSKTGDQEQFGLVRNLASMQTTSNEVPVNDKMGAVPRDKATIEVEGGESVIGDVNKDGNMELMHFVGKKHSQGGVPVDVPEGSFVFSDTKSLTIKDKEVLEKIFGLPFRKQGYTPGQISKNFDINKFVQILKDDNADEITKRTAAEMLRKNKEKLGILAFIQESMKGFPDGIPSIAEEVMAQMGVNPEQLVQESQPQQPAPQEGQPQQGGNPMEGMSPEDQQMMMAMMQQQGGAPMEEQMPMQKHGGLTKYAKAGTVENNPFRINASPFADAENMLLNNGLLYDQNSLLSQVVDKNYDDIMNTTFAKSNTSVADFDDPTNFKKGKIYTFKSRPGSYYKLEDDGKIYIKNEGTGWQYKPMEDPEGKRRKVLEAGFDSGLTREFIKSKPQTKSSSFQLPGFDDKEEFNSFLQSGAVEKVVGQKYKEVLESRDPKKILDLADELEKNDYDVENSWGWIPWSNQDKVQDLPDMLREEASKILDKKQREKFLSNDAANVSTKLKTVIKDLENQTKKNINADIQTRLKTEKELENAKKYLKFVQSKDYKDYIYDIKTNLPQTDPGLLPDWEGDFAGAKAYGYEVEPGVYVGDILKFTNEKYNKIKKINNGKFTPTNLLGDETTLQPISPISSAMTVLSGYDLEDVNYNKYLPDYKQGVGQVSENPVVKNERVTLADMPGVTFRVENSKQAIQTYGQPFYVMIDENGAETAIADPLLYQRLHNAFDAKGKKYSFSVPAELAIEPPVQSESVVQEEPPVKEQLRQAVVKPRATVANQGSVNTVQQPIQPQGKYDGGLSDQDFNDLFKKYGGEMDMYEDGGVIDSDGYMIKLPKSYLRKFDPGGLVSQGKAVKKIGGKDVEVEAFKQIFGDGTELQVIKEVATGNIISKRALPKGSSTGIALRADQNLYRGLTEKATAENLTDEEKAYINKRWAGKTEDYLNFENTRAGLYRDPKLIESITSQFQDITKNQGNRYYTGKDDKTRNFFASEIDKRTGKSYDETLRGMTQDDIMASLLAQEERNALMRAHGYKAIEGDQEVAGFSKKPEYAKWKGDKRAYQLSGHALNFLDANKETLGDLDFGQGYQGQTAYLAYVKALLNDPRYAKNYSQFQKGTGDEGVLGLSSTISGADNRNTNTTLGEFLGFKELEEEVETKTETPQGKWYCVDGTIVQGTIGADGKETAPTGTKVEGPYNDKPTAEGVCKIKATDIEKRNPQYDGWFAPDIVNYTTALGQRTPFTLPTMRQMQAAPSGYDTLNPITHIASITGASKQYSDQLANTMDPTVAAAAASNFDFDALAKGIANVETQNVGIANSAYDRIGQRQAAVDQFNTQARRQYDVDVATAIEERARDANKKDAMLAKLYGQGWWNAARDAGNRERFPQAQHINRLIGKYDFSGQGKDPLGADTGSGSYGNSGDATAEANAAYQKVYDERIKAGDKEDVAKSKAEAAMKQVYNDHNYYRSSKNRNQQDGYSSTIGSAGIQKYGGSLNFTAPDYDFFFGH